LFRRASLSPITGAPSKDVCAVCLAVPAKLVSRSDRAAIADLHGNRVEISTVLVPDVAIGDWVLVHAGFAIQRLSDQEAQKTWSVLEDVRRVSEDPNLPRENLPHERGAP